MPNTNPARVRRLLGTLAAATCLVVALPSSPAWAHTRLTGTDPKADATVTEPTVAVTLSFNEPVRPQLSTVVVTGPDGVVYSDGDARSADRDLIQAIRPLPVGTVTVAWRTVSADGHPVQGQFSFTNAAPGPDPSPPPSPFPSPTVSSSARGSGTSPATSRPAWLIAGGITVVVVAAGILVGWRRRSSGG